MEKAFFGRRWAVSKLARYTNSENSSQDTASDSTPRTVLIVGGVGTGKTSLIKHITTNASDQSIYPHIGAVIYADKFQNQQQFTQNLQSQLQTFFKAHGYSYNCGNSETGTFHQQVVQPLQLIKWKSSSKVLIFIDNIDALQQLPPTNVQQTYAVDLNDSCVSSSLSDMSSSKDNLSVIGPVMTNFCLVDLFLTNHDQLPQWLIVVASCNRRSKTVIKSFSAYGACRKFILDDAKRNDVNNDLRGYCHMRIQNAEQGIFIDDNKIVNDMIDKLMLKSNGCILYLEKVRFWCFSSISPYSLSSSFGLVVTFTVETSPVIIKVNHIRQENVVTCPPWLDLQRGRVKW